MTSKFVLMLAALSLLICACGSPEPQTGTFRQISVTGTGIAKADPDIATIVLGVDVTSEDPAEAVSEAATMINSALSAAQAIGVAEEDISTESYSLWIESVYDPITYQYTGEKIYHVSQYESIVVRDLSTVGNVLSGLVGAGVNTVSSVSFGIEDQATLLDQARAAALADAVERAESMAVGLGVDLGDPVYVSEYSGGYTMYDETLSRNAGITGGADYLTAPSVSPGSFSVSASMTVTFEIE